MHTLCIMFITAERTAKVGEESSRKVNEMYKTKVTTILKLRKQGSK